MAPEMSGVCVISSVLSCCSKNLKQWMNQCSSSMLQLSFIWLTKENISWRCEGGPTQKTQREEKPQAQFWLLYMFFLLPLSLPYINWASQEGCLLYLRSSLWSSDFPWFFFMRFSHLCLLATAILDSFFLF